ncbi:MAG: arginine--tRNA ligase [Candidatus Aenigmarchaeota archaeon]|nr:arginine--tRNA ligase [Candidatus Aenigmarchaeota archaeon]MDW8160356.1 arginine--tRNA ligase [Candidatus Aenigmarchaeota archaeon]
MWKNDISNVLREVGYKVEDRDIEIPQDPRFGDFSFPTFNLAKDLKVSPIELAKEIARKIPVSKYPFLIKVEAVNGYVNFFIYWEKISEQILRRILEGRRPELGRGQKVMIEFSQPNPVHSMHIGHARGTFIGDSLAKIFEYCSHKVIKANYMNDVGLQVAKLVTAYSLWYNGKKPDRKEDYWLWEIYVRFHEEAKKDPSLEEKAREMLRKYEIEMDRDVIKVWNKLVKWCVSGFKKSYRRLKIKFDVWFYEHEFRELGKELVYQAIAKNIAFKDKDGVVVANLENYGLPNVVVLRSDGTGLYFTSDLGLTYHKFKKFKIDKAIWVVSSQQSLYLKQLFKFLELLGFEFAKNCYHCSFEHVNLPEGKMSSREGKAILLDEVLDLLERKAKEEIKKRNPTKDERKISIVAKKIAVGALKYSILKIQPEDQIIFEWEKMLQLNGKTAPYIQYATTRCKGILKKVKKFSERYSEVNFLEEEKNLIKKLNEFNFVLEKCVKEMKPYYLANYLYELAVCFNNFYEKVPVLSEKNLSRRDFRLTLVKAVQKVLEDGLNLLGIECLCRE